MPAVARALSILGHPLVVLPCAVLLAMASAGDLHAAMQVAAGCALIGAVVMAHAWWQVRRGRWSHVDASASGERRSLNRFLLVLLLVGAACAWRFASHDAAIGLAVSATLVVAAMLSSRWCKLSLHVAFAMYAACLLWRIGPWATTLGFAFAASVAWSRLVLARHVARDVVAGALAGLAAGVAFWMLALAPARG